jgi:hypothetical protein
MSKQPKPIIHGRDHDCGGADPIPGICDLKAMLPEGSSRLDLVIPAIGELTLWYRLGDTFTFPTVDGISTGHAIKVIKDTSGFPLPVGNVPHDLDYYEYSERAGWSTASRPTQHEAHPELGATDDGCWHQNYNQPAGAQSAPNEKPGCYIQGSVNGLATFQPGVMSVSQPTGKEMHTLTFLFKIDSTSPDQGQIMTNALYNLGVGGGGWAVSYQKTSGTPYVLYFNCSDSVTGHNIQLSTAPAGLSAETWYYCAVTRDTTTSPSPTYTLWLNGVSVQAVQSPYWDDGYFDRPGGLTIGNIGSGGLDQYFKGSVDEVAIYASTLQAADLLSLYSAAVGTGGTAAGEVLTSDGSGGTTWAMPTVDVAGTRYDSILAGDGIAATNNLDGTVTLTATSTVYLNGA